MLRAGRGRRGILQQRYPSLPKANSGGKYGDHNKLN
jgi:hypothetical protein